MFYGKVIIIQKVRCSPHGKTWYTRRIRTTRSQTALGRKVLLKLIFFFVDSAHWYRLKLHIHYFNLVDIIHHLSVYIYISPYHTCQVSKLVRSTEKTNIPLRKSARCFLEQHINSRMLLRVLVTADKSWSRNHPLSYRFTSLNKMLRQSDSDDSLPMLARYIDLNIVIEY